jgi:KDO2-lipid IV(A) lauroyltransferase
VFCTAIRGYYDLFRAWQLPQEQLVASVDIPEEVRAVVRSAWNRAGGSVLVFPHLSAFDLGAQAMGFYLPETQVLTVPDPPPGFELTNTLRLWSGFEVTPLSSSALRQAIKRLRRGGVVSVAGDRPISDLDEPVPFFGRPACVPSGHVRLALKTGAQVVVACCFLSPLTRKYTMHVEPPLEMIRTGNQDEDVRVNMRQVLDALERIIGRWPEQWQMFVPVWPELVEA